MRTFLGTLIFAFLVNCLGPLPCKADGLALPKPGTMVHLSPAFNPPVLKGLKVYPENPFRFDFVLDEGNPASQARGASLKNEASKLVKYFLASLTIPEKDLWVNLSPYEKDRIVPESFGQTEMGRDLLAQDYMLKQITASLIYPEDDVGKKFWKRIYEEAAKKFGTTNIPVNTFNKVWIVPEKAVVYENAKAGTAYVIESKLKVMLEEDYLAVEKANQPLNAKAPQVNHLSQSILKEVVIPQLTKEVNTGKNFAQLRQVYNSLILATWYKKKIKDSILSQVYADKSKVAGVGHNTTDTEAIYQQYLQAFKKGAYNLIKEEIDPVTQQPIPRKYFSGGVGVAGYLDRAMSVRHNLTPGQLSNEKNLSVVSTRLDAAMLLASPPLAKFTRTLADLIKRRGYKGYRGIAGASEKNDLSKNFGERMVYDGYRTLLIDGQEATYQGAGDFTTVFSYRLDGRDVAFRIFAYPDIQDISNNGFKRLGPKQITPRFLWEGWFVYKEGRSRFWFTAVESVDGLSLNKMGRLTQEQLQLFFELIDRMLDHGEVPSQPWPAQFMIGRIGPSPERAWLVDPDNVLIEEDRYKALILTYKYFLPHWDRQVADPDNLILGYLEKKMIQYWHAQGLLNSFSLEDTMSLFNGEGFTPETERIQEILRTEDPAMTVQEQVKNILNSAQTPYIESNPRDFDFYPSDSRVPIKTVELIEAGIEEGMAAMAKNFNIPPDVAGPDRIVFEVSGSASYLRNLKTGTLDWRNVRDLDVIVYVPSELRGYFFGAEYSEKGLSFGILEEAIKRRLIFKNPNVGILPEETLSKALPRFLSRPYHPQSSYFGNTDLIRRIAREAQARHLELVLYKYHELSRDAIESRYSGFKKLKRLFQLAKLRGDDQEALRLFDLLEHGSESSLQDIDLSVPEQKAEPKFQLSEIKSLVEGYLTSNRAMLGEMTKNGPQGGIDFNSSKMDLQLQNAGQAIQFHPDPAMLEQLQNAPGFVPVIMGIQPLTDLPLFLGLKENGSHKPAAVL